MSDCQETSDVESVQSHGGADVGEPEAGLQHKDYYNKENVSAETDKEKLEEKEDSSVDGFVVMEAESSDRHEEKEADNKSVVAIGCGMEYNEEKITVDDTGSKDLDSTDSPCPSETENLGSREDLDSSSITNKNDDIEKRTSKEIEINDDERSMMVTMFKMFDSDGTGAMSIAELGNFMRAIGMFPTDDEVDDLLTHMDQDKSGMVDQEELIRQMSQQIRKEIDPEHDFKEAFLLFDKDGNGKISREELTDVLTNHGRMKVSLEEAGDYIAMVDTDSDGMLDYSEFVTLFTTKIGL